MPQDETQEAQRRHLLADLFGSEVPSGLTGQLLRTSDVAALFQVSERTVSEWARRGRIPSVRTPGGHRRYPAEQIGVLLRAIQDGSIERGQVADGDLGVGGDLVGPASGRGVARESFVADPPVVPN